MATTPTREPSIIIGAGVATMGPTEPDDNDLLFTTEAPGDTKGSACSAIR